MSALPAYAGAACAAWSAMGLFALRSGAVRRRHGWPVLAGPRDALHGGAACLLCALSLALLLRVDSTEFAVVGWVLQLGSAGVAFALMLPFWPRASARSVLLGMAAPVALALDLLYG